MSEVLIKKMVKDISFLKDQIIELRREIHELREESHQLNPEYEKKLKMLLAEEGTKYNSIKEFDADFE